ncbi:HAD-IA family hydrolase [Marinobacter sp.]|uniref:HAD-IA family hydrolase n=1 Tax=Marinobacter sp. TaxID=50741 RepID=UPI00384B16C5
MNQHSTPGTVAPESARAAVLFDLDGTLLDTAPDFIRCLNQLRTELAMAPLPPQALRNAVSNGARAMVEVGFGLVPEDADYTERHTAFLDLYEAGIAVETRLFPEMESVLEWLESRQIPWGIVTNKPARFTVPLLRALELDQRCAVAICPDHVSQRKPHPEAMYLACRQIGADPGACVYVGDHRRDIEAGRNAGMITVAASYGYIESPAEITAWEPDHIVHSPTGLADLLKILLPAENQT